MGELQKLMKTWLEFSLQGPQQNPGLHLWKGLEYVTVFADGDRGQDQIVTCLKKYKTHFHKFGFDKYHQETWKCSNMEFLKEPATAVKSQSPEI